MGYGSYFLALAAVGLAGSPSAGADVLPPSSQQSPPPGPVASPAAAWPDHMLALELGETAVLDTGLKVSFEAVIGDSRCPTDVQCVWEGNAEIELEVTLPGEDPASLRLNTNPGFTTEATYLAYVIELVDLVPYPRTTSPLPAPYQAALLVGNVDDRGPGPLIPAG